MSTSFPTGLDAYSAVPANQNTITKHRDRHQNVEDAIEAIEAKVGVNGSAVATSLDYLVAQLYAQGLSLFQFTQAEALSDPRSVLSKLRDIYCVKDFGAVGNGIADDTQAFKDAITAISLSQTQRGAIIYAPRGSYKLTDTLTFNSYATDNAVSIMFEGDGPNSTILDFRSMTGGKNGLYVPNDQQVTFKDFFLWGGGSTADGIRFGSTAGGGNAVSIANLENIRVQGWGRDGVSHYNTYMCTMERVYCLSNGRDGFRFDGFHTSITAQNCYARGHAAGAGFRINGMTYSHFLGCGSDVNAFGFVGSNMRSTVFSGCGAEGNNQDGWFFFADNAGAPTSNPLFVSECYDVHGVLLIGCSGYGNNIGAAGYAGLVRIDAAGVHSGSGTFNDGSPHTVDVVVDGGDANASVPGTKALVTAQSAGGVAKLTERGPNYFPGGRTVGAGTIVRNRSLAGMCCTVTRTTNQSITASTPTAVTWEAEVDAIDGWVVGSPTRLTVPAGVNHVRLQIAAGWAADATGSRQVTVRKNGSATAVAGLPYDERAAAGTLPTSCAIVSPPLAVVAGDYFEVWVQQTTAGAINLLADHASFTMEVVD